MSSFTEQRLGILIERLSQDLREALGPDVLQMLVLYIAASELLCEDLQPLDRGALRFSALHLAMQALGLTDAAVERQKLELSGRYVESLDRRQ